MHVCFKANSQYVEPLTLQTNNSGTDCSGKWPVDLVAYIISKQLHSAREWHSFHDVDKNPYLKKSMVC